MVCWIEQISEEGVHCDHVTNIEECFQLPASGAATKRSVCATRQHSAKLAWWWKLRLPRRHHRPPGPSSTLYRQTRGHHRQSVCCHHPSSARRTRAADNDLFIHRRRRFTRQSLRFLPLRLLTDADLHCHTRVTASRGIPTSHLALCAALARHALRHSPFRCLCYTLIPRPAHSDDNASPTPTETADVLTSHSSRETRNA